MISERVHLLRLLVIKLVDSNLPIFIKIRINLVKNIFFVEIVNLIGVK